MNVRFCTTEYEFSHGRKPRGFGLWAFRTMYSSAPPVFTPTAMTLTDAKRWARKTMFGGAVAENTRVLEVCS